MLINTIASDNILYICNVICNIQCNSQINKNKNGTIITHTKNNFWYGGREV